MQPVPGLGKVYPIIIHYLLLVRSFRVYKVLPPPYLLRSSQRTGAWQGKPVNRILPAAQKLSLSVLMLYQQGADHAASLGLRDTTLLRAHWPRSCRVG